MRTLSLLVAGMVLLAPSAGLAASVTVGPDSLAVYWYSYAETIRMLPGTYVVGEPAGYWPLRVRSWSPSLVGIGGPEGVIIQGTGLEQAFYLEEGTYDAHIHFEGITFSGLAEIIGRPSSISSEHGSLRFTDNIVEGCGIEPYGPALRTTECWGTVARNVFRNNLGPAIVTYHTSAVIEDNEIYGNPDGIRDSCCESPPVRGNHVHDNSGIGIDTGYSEGGPIEYNLIERNGGTGLMLGSYFDVEHNIVRENTRGVACGGMLMGNASVHCNDIYDNAEYNLMSASEAPLTHDCAMNWWGSIDPVVIAEGIRDCNDDPELNATVVFEPFCMSPGCEAVPVESVSWGRIKAFYRQ